MKDMTVAEAATKLGVGKQRVHNMIRDGQLVASKAYPPGTNDQGILIVAGDSLASEVARRHAKAKAVGA